MTAAVKFGCASAVALLKWHMKSLVELGIQARSEIASPLAAFIVDYEHIEPTHVLPLTRLARPYASKMGGTAVAMVVLSRRTAIRFCRAPERTGGDFWVMFAEAAERAANRDVPVLALVAGAFALHTIKLDSEAAVPS
jgi:hypothetical protein